MALQVALNQLRHSKETNVKKNDENQRPSLPESRKAGLRFETATSTASLFSVDEAELFNFSDEDFLPNVNPFPSPPQAPRTAASTCSSSSTTTAIDSERGVTSVAELRSRGSNPSLIAGASPHNTATSSKSSQSSQLSDSECSPATKTLEKLRSFKFVKTSNLKSRSVHTKRPPTSDDQSELTPPSNKRRSISDDNSPPSDSVARCADISKINSGSTFKQPSFNPRTSLTCTPSSQSERQSALRVGSKVTPIAHRSRTPDFVASHSQSIENSPMVVAGLPSTPTLSQCRASSMHGGMLSTPQSTPNSSQSNARLTTPQRRAVADPTMQTPTRARQTTPLVSTPTGSGVTTPIARASVPLRRKFPGPAGLLPSLAPGQSMDNIYIPPPSTPTPASTPREKRLGLSATPVVSSAGGVSSSPPPACAPEDAAIFTSSPWTDMMRDLDLNTTNAQSTALLQYSISSALKQASSKQLRNGKVIHLRAVIKSIVPAGKNASALLKDPTGEVMCTIHSKVVEDHQKELQPGAVLVLRQISVFSPSARKHYFNITPSNIIRIYPTNSQEKTVQVPLSLSDILGSEDSGDTCSTSEHSQCSSSLKEFNPTGVTNFNNCQTFSRLSRQEQETGGPRSSHQKTTAGPLPLPRAINSTERSSSNLQSLTRGAASFLAARKQQSSGSNLSTGTSHSPKAGVDTDANSTRKVTSSNSSSVALLLDDLPCDFDDFSDDDGMCVESGDIQALLPGGESSTNTHVAREEMGTSDVNVNVNSMARGDKTAPKESSFFNKLCEEEFDSLFNDIADDGLDF